MALRVTRWGCVPVILGRRWTKWLSSSQLAVVLFAAMGVLLLVGSNIPQRGVVGESAYEAWAAESPSFVGVVQALGLDTVFSSWVFICLSLLLVANVVACTLQRIGRRRRRSARAASAPPPGARAIGTDIRVSALDGGLRASMRGRWRVHSPQEGQWVVESGRLGFTGSIVMHAGLVVVVLAGVISGLTRFSGTMVLAEGQTVTDAPEAYLSVTQLPRLGGGFTGAPITLEALDFTYEDGVVTDAKAIMISDDGGRVRRQEAAVNHPFRSQGKAYLMSDAGYAVGLHIERDSGVLFDSYVNLGTVVPEGFADDLRLADGTVVNVVAVPDRAIRPGQTAQDALVLRDPQVHVAVTDTETNELTTALLPGQTSRLGDLEVSLIDVRLWNTFLVRADRGLPIMYWAFAMVLLGAVLRWWDADTAIGVLVDSPEATADVYLWSKTRYGHSLVRSGERSIERVVRGLQGCGDS